jgi:hypothetical protein
MPSCHTPFILVSVIHIILESESFESEDSLFWTHITESVSESHYGSLATRTSHREFEDTEPHHTLRHASPTSLCSSSLPFITFHPPQISLTILTSHHVAPTHHPTGVSPPTTNTPSASPTIYSSLHLPLTSSTCDTIYQLHHSFHLSPVVLTPSSQWHYYYHYYHQHNH